ncbi:MAG: ATP-dependent RNA helicase DbpA [Arcobacteraceae bacterium]|nr:ATP-dependent RNA helicase DbpA [Arcobacteraceae bacterium]
MQNQFKTLSLGQNMIDNLSRLGYNKMTPIQEQSLPLTLEGKDIIAQAQTGSGKTVAFSLAILNKLKIENFAIQSLVLCPTRELANQVASEMKKLAKFKHNIKITTLCGGVPYKPQVHSLSHQAHIIVGTPGRVLKHLSEDTFTTENINTLVLDEADRMLDMGFNEDINKIIDFLPKRRQTLLFSATYPSNIQTLAKNILIDPIEIKIESEHSSNTIEQIFYESEISSKKDTILKLLSEYNPETTIIFCNTKIACDNLADELEDDGIETLVLHSDLEQRDRSETLILFANKSYPVLIATDVASRGLDIDDINLVINYNLPFDNEVYTHRIGRTARAGKSGRAISLVDDGDIERFDELNYENNYKLIQSNNLTLSNNFKLKSKYKTLFINSGKKNKMRAGDILGALTAGIGLNKNDIGKIDILEFSSYVAIDANIITKAHQELQNSRIKGKYFKVYIM